MRCWARLIAWAEEERRRPRSTSGSRRRRRGMPKGGADSGAIPSSSSALRWRRENQPTAAWARRYDDASTGAMAFLDREHARVGDRHRARRSAPGARRCGGRSSRRCVLGTMLIVGGRPGGDRAAREPARGGQPSAGASGGRRVALVGRSRAARASAPIRRTSRSSGASCCRRPSASTKRSCTRRPAAKSRGATWPWRMSGSDTSTG